MTSTARIRTLLAAMIVASVSGCVRQSPGAGAAATSQAAGAEPQAYLFSYFTRNGEDGVHLAYSRNGINWLPLNGGKSVITPAITGKGRGELQ